MFKKLFHKWVIEKFSKIAAAMTTVFSILIIYIPLQCQGMAFWVLLGVLFLSYLGVVICANLKKRVTIKIRNTKIIIKSGDLFKESGYKVIPVNEYFDVDIKNGIIDGNSLHGQYIEKYAKCSPKELYKNIIGSLGNKNLSIIDQQKELGGKNKYKLGTIYKDKHGFLLLAYSTFDNNNRAWLHNDDIVQCYTNMWNEIDIVRGSNSIAFPVLGAGGIVRFDKDYTPQQLIELLLWSFRVSGIQLSRGATLTIVVHDSIARKIDFLKLKNYAD